ncbi:hypothetical protein BJY01DRAFT_208860 [Aspergillus pseudoustus]|uniref:Uncharacterized protein n=1 Tax=Aspergillus pseudoustus TaxID=1810923 RepID=A0ABR4KK20_9EURO
MYVTFPSVWEERFGFLTQEVGYAYLSPGIALFIASIITGRLSDTRRAKAQSREPGQEDRTRNPSSNPDIWLHHHSCRQSHVWLVYPVRAASRRRAYSVGFSCSWHSDNLRDEHVLLDRVRTLASRYNRRSRGSGAQYRSSNCGCYC